MKTVEIVEAFTGFPNEKERAFAIGETPELSNELADLYIGKGHAREVKPAAKKKELDA